MSPRLRSALLAAGAAAAVLIVTQVALPGGGQGRGTPLAILSLGLVVGMVNGLLATGLVLIYRSARIINFAQSAMGALGGAFAFNLVLLNDWPYPAAFIVGVGVSALLGVLVEVLFLRRFFHSPRLAVTVLTIAIAGLIVGFNQSILQSLPIFPEDVGPAELAQQLTLPFPNWSFRIGELALDFGFGHVFAAVMALLAFGGLSYFLKFTRAGVAVRASAENSERAELLGISVKTLSTIVWAIAGTLAGLSVILSEAVTRTSVGALAPAALVPALAAAVIGRMRRISVVVGTSVGLSVLQAALNWSFEEFAGLLPIGFFVVILVGLLVQRKELQRLESAETTTWKATEEIRPTPRELGNVGGIRAWRLILLGLFGAALLLYPWLTTTGATNFGGFVAITGIVLLSLVVLTGWAGQVSLGQYALVAVGAAFGGAMTSRWDWPFWLALLAAPLVSSVVAVLIGLPALRIKGLFLAITTFAFAFVVESTLFSERYFGWLIPERIERPTVFLLDFDDERSMYYLAVGAFLLCTAVVTALRRHRTGRVFIGLRDNEAHMQSFAIKVIRTRLTAFAFSGFLCGLAGILLAHHQRAVSAGSFSAQQSLDVFLLAVVGGISSVSGAILGVAYSTLKNFASGDLEFWIGPAGTVIILYLFPGGLASMAYALRDAIYRIVAQRNQLVVPSLLADYNPAALERKLIPISKPEPGSPLLQRLLDRRYQQISTLYASRGRLLSLIGDRRTVAAQEAAAFDAAIDALEPKGD